MSRRPRDDAAGDCGRDGPCDIDGDLARVGRHWASVGVRVGAKLRVILRHADVEPVEAKAEGEIKRLFANGLRRTEGDGRCRAARWRGAGPGKPHLDQTARRVGDQLRVAQLHPAAAIRRVLHGIGELVLRPARLAVATDAKDVSFGAVRQGVAQGAGCRIARGV